MTIRIILADDHPAILAGIHHELQARPDFDVVGLARSAQELTQLLQTQSCDVLITDYAMPDGESRDGMALISHLQEQHPDLKIIVFTTLDNPALSQSLKDKGVRAVVTKTSDFELLATAIRSTHKLTDADPQQGATKEALLSAREEEVVRLYVSGLSINEIAEKLGRTKQTISSQKSNAMLKLGLSRDADLFRFALETGLVSAAETFGDK